MKAGNEVWYHDGSGTRTAAAIAAVRGAGQSGFKMLDLVLRDTTLTEVPHARDAIGRGYWLAFGELPLAPATPAPVKSVWRTPRSPDRKPPHE